MDQRPWTEATIVAILAGAVVGGLAVWTIASFIRRIRLKYRTGRARRMELRAAGMLEAAGYTVIDTQVAGQTHVVLNGTSLHVEVRADYLVTRAGRTFVAEAKSGARAPDVTNRATRRQLLEYAIAYDTDGVLLVDTESGTVYEVEFPALRPAERAHRFWWGVGVGVAVTLAGAALAFAVR